MGTLIFASLPCAGVFAEERYNVLEGAVAWPANNHARWVYGSTPTLGGSFTPYLPANALASYNSMNAYRYSQAAFPNYYPILAFNPSTNRLSFDAGQFQVPGETVDLLPGPAGAYAVARFLAPGPDPYRIRGHFLGLEAPYGTVPGTRTDVHVLRNSTNSLFSETVVGQFTEQSFDLVVQLDAGDTVDFAVGYGSDASIIGDSTGLQAILVPVRPVLTLLPGNPPSLSWPTNATGYALEFATSLSSADAWSGFAGTPTVVGTNYVVTDTGGEARRFFRLRRP